MMRAFERLFVMCFLPLCGLGGCVLDEEPATAPDDDVTDEEETFEPVGELDLQAEPADELYVSLSGNDHNSGTVDHPFRSLESARDAVRERLRANPSRSVTVWLRAGRYERRATLELGAQDSGTASAPVVWRAYPGERASLVGGRLLDPSWFRPITSASPAWSRLDTEVRTHVVQVDLSAHGITDYGELKWRGFGVPAGTAAMELFVDGVPQELARFPDANSTEPKKGFLTIASKVNAKTIRYTGDRPARWTADSQVWFHGLWGNTWADEHKRATRIDTANHTITFVEEPKYPFKAGQPFYAYNLLDEITVPGEWYLDRDTGILYLYPKTTLSGKAIVVSMLEEPLVKLSGASHVRFQDLTFEAGRNDLVQVTGGTGVVLDGLLLRNAGRRGATMSGTRHVVRRCEVTGTGERGVAMQGGDRVSLARGDNLIERSRFFKYGRWVWMYEPGLSLHGVGNVARKNLIYESPHSGILWGGNDQLIELNEIHDVCRSASDAGAIYSGRDWGARGNVIRHNFIHHVSTWLSGLGVHGVYLDDTLAGPRVEGNVFYKIQGAALKHGGGRDIRMVNNILAKCGTGLATDARGPSIFDKITVLEKLIELRYQAEPWRTRYPKCAAIPNTKAQVKAGKWLYPEGVAFSRNLGWQNTKWQKVKGNATSYFAEIKDNVQDQNPLFVDEAHLNLALSPASPALDIPGFQAIPFDDIGP